MIDKFQVGKPYYLNVPGTVNYFAATAVPGSLLAYTPK